MNSPSEAPRLNAQAEERVTALLRQWRFGDDEALARLIPAIYDELQRLAGSYLHGNAAGATLGPTTLVHEFYLKASGLRDVDWESRGQFIAAAARAMRNLLVDNARRRMSEKHGGGRVESLGDNDVSVLQPEIEVLAVHEALDKLAAEYPRHARIVELIFFGGLSAAEVSEALSDAETKVSQRTVERDWRFARAWLKNQMTAH
jgi:RNA polymerase sigma factor (TIGR02999 family)